MATLWAKQALTSDGWQENVRIDIDEKGFISSVCAESPPCGTQLDILLPAVSNLHSHAFQRSMAGLTERRGPSATDSFWTWRQLMYRFLDQLRPDHIEAITAFVQMEMLEAGYATNTEFHYLHHRPDGQPYDHLGEMAERVISAAHQTGIGLTLLPVHYQYGGCDQRPLGSGQIRFGNTPDRFARLFEDCSRAIKTLSDDARIGVAPHSLRAVDPKDLSDIVKLAGNGPIHMHLAEQIAEVTEVKEAWGLRPVEWLFDHMNITSQWCLIHCTQMLPHETEMIAQSGAVAGLCPITESSLGDGIFDGVRYLEDGGIIGIGSDSNIRISLSEELRTLDYSQRLRDHSRAALATGEKSTARRLYDCVCQGGARASGRPSGMIKSGMLADLMALDGNAVDLIDRTGDTVLDCFVFAGDDHLVSDVWSAGRHLVRGGKHLEHQTITDRYKNAMKQIGDKL